MEIDKSSIPGPEQNSGAEGLAPSNTISHPSSPSTQTPITRASKAPERPHDALPPANSRAKDDHAIAPPNAILESHKARDTPQRTSTPTTNRKGNAAGTTGLNAMRIPYLKKEDGQPFWRKDIGFNFLSRVFHNQTRVFTKLSNGSRNHTFSEIYIDAMAKSSKCSGTLKEKLISDNSSAIDMAMICLLVNVGRMNTTLNFFPEMRARVRTYHPIPCLQAQQGGKGLQDGPRLKSILKGATEDTPQPSTIEEIVAHAKPRTNPVNLLFVLSQYAPKVSSDHFPASCDFFDLFIRSSLSSETRARAFLWLIWWYLESDFTTEDARRNPFGSGEQLDGKGPPLFVPTMEVLNAEQADAENLDTDEEKAFGEAKRLEREDIIASDAPPSAGSARRPKTVATEPQGHQRRLLSPGSQLDSESARSPLRGSHSPSRSAAPLSHAHHANRRRSLSPPTGFQAINATPNGERILTDSRLSLLQGEELQRTPSSASKRGLGSSGPAKRGRETPLDPGNSSQPPLYPAPTPPNTMNPYQSTLNLGSYQNGSFTPDAESKNASNGAAEPPGSGGDTGRKVKKFVSLEQQRRQRVDRILWDRIRDEQSQKRREQRAKGSLFESMLKCKAMPSAWDSDEDDPHRSGGLDYLLPDTQPLSASEGDTVEIHQSVGDIGALAKAVSSGVRGYSKVVEHTVIPRPSTTVSSRRFDDAIFKEGAAPCSTSIPVVHTARMAIDDPRRKRPYKPRAKRNPELQPSMGTLDLSTPGAKRKRGSAGASALKRSSGRGRSGKAGGPARAGERGVPISDFLRGADDAAGSEISFSERPGMDDVDGDGDGDTEMQGGASPGAMGADDDEGDTEDAGDDSEMDDVSDEEVEMAEEE